MEENLIISNNMNLYVFIFYIYEFMEPNHKTNNDDILDLFKFYFFIFYPLFRIIFKYHSFIETVIGENVERSTTRKSNIIINCVLYYCVMGLLISFLSLLILKVKL